MKHIGHYCRHWGWRIAVVGLLAGGTSARAGEWGSWPVPWPPPGSVNPPGGGGTVVPPPVDVPPPGGGNEPPPVDVPPPGVGVPPPGAEPPPEVPVPPTTTTQNSPEPASAVMALSCAGAGILAWRRKRVR